MNLTFLIPVKLESQDRVRNLTTIITYLLHHFDAKVSVQECDKVQNFYNHVLPSLNERFTDVSDRLEYHFEEQKSPFFHKTKILNDLLVRSDTEVVCNYDVDALFPKTSYDLAYEMIMRNQTDVVYPYGCGVYQKAITYSPETFESFIDSDMDVTYLDKYATINNSTIGWCQFIRRKNYLKSFMMNENFHAWGPEDCELYYRLNYLGNRVTRIDDYVYHLEHSRTNDSWFSNPLWKENVQLWHWLQTQTPEQYVKYYQKQDYVKRRLDSVSI